MIPMRFCALALGFFVSISSLELLAENELFPESITDLSNFQLGDADYDFNASKFRIELTLNCYRVNVRSHKHGLNTYGNLLMSIPIKNRSTGNLFKVEFPAGMFFGRPPGAFVARVVGTEPPQTKVGFDAKTRTLLIETPRAATNETLERPTFYQVAYSPAGVVQNVDVQVLNANGQPFLFPPGEPSSDLQTKTTYVEHYVSMVTAADGLVVKARASFPGALHQCGSYKSPLMLFFDERNPSFTGQSRTLASENNGNATHWVEPGAPGYFLALDGNGDGIISDGSELFAGFEKLSPFDSNEDGRIDKRDAKFDEFVLWNDKDGNGRSSKGELKTLKELGVTNLSLKFSSETRNFGHHAVGDQFGTFQFINARNGKLASGRLIDLWFESK